MANIQGNYLDNQYAPSSVQTFTDFFEASSNICDNCATELVGYFLAPIAGGYIFQIAADDYGGATEQAGAIIATCPGWAASRQWDKYSEQTSSPQQLTAQEYYFLCAMSNEGGGGDNLAVGAIMPDGTLLQPIPGKTC